MWCSNDYIGMERHPRVLEAMLKALDRFGAGSGGTHNSSVHKKHTVEPENTIAQLHLEEVALLFILCFVPENATLTLLGSKIPGYTIYLDNATMIGGMRHSKVHKMIDN